MVQTHRNVRELKKDTVWVLLKYFGQSMSSMVKDFTDHFIFIQLYLKYWFKYWLVRKNWILQSILRKQIHFAAIVTMCASSVTFYKVVIASLFYGYVTLREVLLMMTWVVMTDCHVTGTFSRHVGNGCIVIRSLAEGSGPLLSILGKVN